MLVTPRKYPVVLLVFILVLGAVTPCGLLESDGDAVCTSERADSKKPEDADTDTIHFDCCAGCLTCCASFVEEQYPKVLRLFQPVRSVYQGVDFDRPGDQLPIWRPPRA